MKPIKDLISGLFAIPILLLNINCIAAGGDSTLTQRHKIKNELAINGLRLINMFDNNTAYQPQMLGYKRYYKNVAFRAIASHSLESFHNSNMQIITTEHGNYAFSGVETNINTQFKLGIQVNKPLNKSFRLYYGADLIYTYGAHNTADFTQDDRGYPVTYITSENHSQTLTKGYGIAAIAGLQYFIIPNFAISLEGNLSAISSYSTAHHSGNSIVSTRTSYDYQSYSSNLPNSHSYSIVNSAVNRPYCLNVSVLF